MNTTIGYKLVKSKATNLTANRVECTDNDSFGRVIYDNLNTGSSLKGTDVTTLTANDASLNFIVINMEYADGVLNGSLGSNALDSLNDNLLGLLVGIELGFVHDFVNIAGSIKLGLVFQTLNKTIFCFLCTKA